MSRRTSSLFTAAVLSLGLAAGTDACGSSHPPVTEPTTLTPAKPSPTPAGPRYKAVGNVCALLSDQVASTYITAPKSAGGTRYSDASETSRDCTWSTNWNGPKAPRGAGSINVTITWHYDSRYGETGTQLAQSDYRNLFRANKPSGPLSSTAPIPGADESWSSVKMGSLAPTDEPDGSSAGLDARRGNVVLVLGYSRGDINRTQMNTAVRRLGQYLLAQATAIPA
ncbi:hypothetical protein [Actinoallomurus soli]|uniref:hypothetical protein n=1 Tax=Actinoallomurus soli TaxID=2952535 RepID=UPI002093EABB|nr:hypothetical protein [Actinoallomurus soli]MCO5968702.1 hypothetical protein [Actinoallomurus soli]